MADRGQVGADLVGAPGLEPDPQQRRARQQLARPRSASRAARRASVRVDITLAARAVAARAARRSCRCAASGRPVDERQVLALDLARADHAAAAPVGVARTSPPPSAPRCRGRAGARSPAAPGPSPPAARPASACASVVPAVAGRRVHDHAGGLVDHQQVLVLEHDLEADVRRRGSASRVGLGDSTTHRSPAASRWRLGRASPSTVTAPASISRCGRRARAAPPRARQERVEPLPGVVRRRRSGRLCAVRSISTTTEQQRSTPTTMQTSARLNAGQAIGSMKSITAPSRARSARLPSAPPRSSPTGSHSHGHVAVARRSTRSGTASESAIRTATTRARRPRARRTRRPRCARCVRSRPEEDVHCSPRSSEATAIAFVDLVERHDHGRRGQRGRAAGRSPAQPADRGRRRSARR